MDVVENLPRLGCVVLAAGSAQRFGANKLSARWEGKPLIRRSLEAIPAQRFVRTVVVTQYPEFMRLAKEFSFAAVLNDRPDLGISRSLKMGLTALRDCDAVLFQVSDQPLLRRETVDALLDAYLAQPEKIAALSHNGKRGNPCVFPARFFPELMALEGDRGGSVVIRRHSEAVTLLETEAAQLADVDTPAAMEALKTEC